MKIWSRGLGKISLDFDLGECDVDVENDELILKGKVKKPVDWEFWIRISRDDTLNLLKIGMSRASFSFFIKYALHLFFGGLPRERNIGRNGRIFRILAGCFFVAASPFFPSFIHIFGLEFLLAVAFFGAGILSIYQGITGRCWLRELGIPLPF
jgi:hypothetical protein